MIVVTGASGHVGANLVRALLARGGKVRVLVRDDTRAVEGLPVERVCGDVGDIESLREAFRGADVVYHCAGRISLTGWERPSSLKINVEGTRNVARACLETGVRRLVHVSSIHALSEEPADRPVSEANGLCRECEKPLPYSRSKAEGECEVLRAVKDGLDAVILNPSGVVGPHDYKLSRMGETIRDLASGRFPALVPGAYDYVDARDVAEAAILAGAKGRRGERYLIGGHRLSVRELAERVGEVSGAPVPRWTCPMWLARSAAPFSEAWNTIRGRRPRFTGPSLQVLRSNSFLDCSKARSELGYSPRPIRLTLEDTIAWQRQAGILR